jgi:hypothetical protein
MEVTIQAKKIPQLEQQLASERQARVEAQAPVSSFGRQCTSTFESA